MKRRPSVCPPGSPEVGRRAKEKGKGSTAAQLCCTSPPCTWAVPDPQATHGKKGRPEQNKCAEVRYITPPSKSLKKMRILNCINFLSRHPFINVILVGKEQWRVIESYEEMADLGASFLCLFLGNGRTIYTKRKKNIKKSKPNSVKKPNQNNPPHSLSAKKTTPKKLLYFLSSRRLHDLHC